MVTQAGSTKIERVDVSAFTVPTDGHEADGTYAWDSTTMVLVEVSGGGARGIGYTYADSSTAVLIRDKLAKVVEGRDAMGVEGAWHAMVASIRNLGRPGIASMAISAVDVALWDLKARLLDLPLYQLLGQMRDAVPVYGSGGFTSYSIQRLQDQLAGWVSQGIPRVKMKIGTHPADDLERVKAARAAIGDAQLYVDANGAYARKQALAQAAAFAEQGVVYFEEPVSSDDLDGLHLIRDRAPDGMEIAAGEYGYDLFYFRHMLEAEAVDIQQADGSRCGGITGFLKVSALTQSRGMPISAHCAPTLHVPVACAVPHLYPIEYFHDHVRIEHLFFDGALSPVDGALRPDPSRPGLGIEFKRSDAEPYAI